MQTSLDLRLARHGVIVLLLGLLTGFVIGKFHNHGVGNAAHLTGLIGGFGLIAVGLLWPRLNLSPFWSVSGAWITALSMYLSWLGLTLRGWFGTGLQAPSTSLPGSLQIWDRTGGLMIMAGAYLSLLSTLLVLFGLRKLASRETTGASSEAVHQVAPGR